MQTIGLIGGISWESTALYYQVINRQVKELLGGFHSCQCLLYSVEFNELIQLQRQGDWDAVAARMVEAGQRLERGGADLILLCSNTMHKVADQLQAEVNLPLLHIADTTAAEIKKQRLQRVGLLGTKYTMEQDFLRKRFREVNGIDTLVPNGPDRDTVHRIIYEELANGIILEQSRHEYLRIIETLVAEGAEGIILGCTEIGLLLQQEHTPIPLFDTVLIHAHRAVEIALIDKRENPRTSAPLSANICEK